MNNVIANLNDINTTPGMINKIAQTAATAVGLGILISVKKDTKYTRKGVDRIETKLDTMATDIKAIKKQNADIRADLNDIFVEDEPVQQTPVQQQAPAQQQTPVQQQEIDMNKLVTSILGAMYRGMGQNGEPTNQVNINLNGDQKGDQTEEQQKGDQTEEQQKDDQKAAQQKGAQQKGAQQKGGK